MVLVWRFVERINAEIADYNDAEFFTTVRAVYVFTLMALHTLVYFIHSKTVDLL